MKQTIFPLLLKSRDLAFDLDDVLAPFALTICEKMNLEGALASVDDYSSYRFFDFHGLSIERFKSLIIENNVFSIMRPLDGAIKTLYSLVRKGFRIHIVTARGGFDGAFAVTEEWFKTYHAPIASLTLMGAKRQYSKSIYYNKIGVSMFVDDAPHNIIDAVNNAPDVLPFVVTRPWNVNNQQINDLVHDGVVFRISDVAELVDLIELDPSAL